MWRNIIIGTWCTLQVVGILSMSIIRIVPIVAQLFRDQNEMNALAWSATFIWCCLMAYYEGYKGFYLKFCPVVVERSFTLEDPVLSPSVILGGPYAMGLFKADKHRLITSWTLLFMIFWMIKLVKLLPYPYRAMVDAGVLVGISCGILSLVWLTARRARLTIEAIREHARIKATRKSE
jgi:hypothetical protein